MNRKVIAIYARKSKATDKGESLKVQIEKCKQLALYKYSDYDIEFIIYEEQEGKSGANLDREKFREMMNDITSRKKTINLLLVYKLDRLTRSVQDFTEIYEVLSAFGTEFISVKEDFDTTSPMGRAMLTITVVFAQLEREVIAERIQDAMMELAKTGRWLGGMTPYAYSSKVSGYVNEAGHGKNKYHLEIIPEEAQIIQMIYSKYLELGSLSKLETYLLEMNYRTRNGVDFRRYSIKFILTNPVYCCADWNAFEYFSGNGYHIYSPKESFEGTHGIMAYNKTQSVKNLTLDMETNESRWKKKEDWIIAVGEHTPLIPGGDWIKVQKMLSKNKVNSYRNARTTDALLSGLIKCKCGFAMRPKTTGNLNREGDKAFYYLCEMKERSKGTRCSEGNIAGNMLDQLVAEKITTLEKELSPIYHQTLEKYKKMKFNNEVLNASQKDYLLNQIEKTKRYLENINKAILQATSDEAIVDFTVQYQSYLEELTLLQHTKKQKEEEQEVPYDENEFIKLLCIFDYKFWNSLTYDQKKYALKELIDEIKWDGKEVAIYFKGSRLETI